jgi:hypothetical protein
MILHLNQHPHPAQPFPRSLAGGRLDTRTHPHRARNPRNRAANSEPPLINPSNAGGGARVVITARH